MELTINGQVYSFNFNLGFLREINKKAQSTIPNVSGVKKALGLQLAVANLIDGDVEELIDVLFVANKGQDLRVTKTLLESYIDDPDTDIDSLFEDVLGFLSASNATRKITLAILEEIKK